MIIEQYGIQLKRITLDDIELVRKWRNQAEIRKHMEFKRYISKEMQLKWFHGINTPTNYFFLILYQSKPIGVINCKNINTAENYGEGGIFTWNVDEAAAYAPVFASLCMLNTIFSELKLFNKSFVKVHNSNTKALLFNKSLGYVKVPGQDHKNFNYYLLTREDYFNKAQKWIHLAEKISGDKQAPRITCEPGPTHHPLINSRIIEKIKNGEL